MRSKIEIMMLDAGFDYLQPYFYENPYALRCELGAGGMRAEEIYRLLFPRGADAIVFSHWVRDWSGSGGAGEPEVPARILEQERDALCFLLQMQARYRHAAVKHLKTYLEPDDPDYADVRRNRILCWSDGKGFDDLGLIGRQLADREELEIGLLSFENECVLSVYDDRGCDVVFATADAMRAKYAALRPYFLPYDLAEMEARFQSAQ